MNCAPVNVSMRVLRETFLVDVQGLHSRSRRDQRDGFVQRNRWRSVARQQVAAARRAAERMGLQRLCRFRLLRDLGTAAIGPTRMAILSPPTRRKPVRLSVKAGVNIELPEPDCYLHLVELVKKRVLKESQLDELVAPMLVLEIQAGAVRRSVRRSGRSRARCWLRRTSQAGAAGGARNDHAVEK